MDICEAIRTRFTCRAFRPAPVPQESVAAILELAGRAPSGGNLQPWRVWALAGDDLEALKAKVRTHTAAGQLFEGEVEYAIYPEPLKEPYAGRRFRNGEGWYGALGIARDDMPARIRQVSANFELYGAPVGLFLAVDRSMGPPQWADLGLFLQTLMLAARAYGLHTAPLEAWSLWPRTVREHLEMPEELMLFCAVALGEADPEARANGFRAEREPVEAFAIFRGFAGQAPSPQDFRS